MQKKYIILISMVVVIAIMVVFKINSTQVYHISFENILDESKLDNNKLCIDLVDGINVTWDTDTLTELDIEIYEHKFNGLRIFDDKVLLFLYGNFDLNPETRQIKIPSVFIKVDYIIKDQLCLMQLTPYIEGYNIYCHSLTANLKNAAFEVRNENDEIIWQDAFMGFSGSTRMFFSGVIPEEVLSQISLSKLTINPRIESNCFKFKIISNIFKKN